MNDQRFGQTQGSQTGSDTDGRSPEYSEADTRRQGSTNGDISGDTSPGGAMSGANLSSGTSAAGGDTSPGGAWDSSTIRQETREMGNNTDGLGRDQTERVTADETNTLIAADKVQGTAVYDAGGERLGTIDSLMLNKRSGKVAYAVMSFGGFLGIGERYHPLPWDKLTYDTDKGGYNIGYTQDELRAGPTYSRDEIDDFDGDRSRGVDDYYGRNSALGGGITGATGVPIV